MFVSLMTLLLVCVAMALPRWSTMTIVAGSNMASSCLFPDTNASSYHAEYGLWGICVSDVQGINMAGETRLCFEFFRRRSVDVPCALVSSSYCSKAVDKMLMIRGVENACSNAFQRYTHSSAKLTDPQQFIKEACGSFGEATFTFAIFLAACIGIATLLLGMAMFTSTYRRRLLRLASWTAVLALFVASFVLLLWLRMSKPLRETDADFGTAYYMHLIISVLLLAMLCMIARYFTLPPEAFKNTVDKSPVENTAEFPFSML